MSKYHTRYTDVEAYITKDGSCIRELIHPHQQRNQNQSLAEAIVEAGQQTALHKHINTEEIYYITAGEGEMTLGDEQFNVRQGDTIVINPGTPHCILNTGHEPLTLLCSCSPAYKHDDTILI